MVLTSARVGRRKVSRSVATTLGLASRKVTLEKSCNMSGSVEVTKVKSEHANERGGPVSRLPWSLRSLLISRTPPVRSGTRRTPNLIHRLFSRLCKREHRDEGAAVGFGLERYAALDLGEQGVVRAHADIKAGMPGGAALTRNDVAGNHDFPAERLDPKALALGIATVAR